MFCIYLYILYVCMMSALCLHWQGARGPCVIIDTSKKTHEIPAQLPL